MSDELGPRVTIAEVLTREVAFSEEVADGNAREEVERGRGLGVRESEGVSSPHAAADVG